jgi:Cytochrome c554 and c-prime
VRIIKNPDGNMVKHFFSLFVLGVIFSFCPPFLRGAIAANPVVSPTQDNVRYVGSVTCQSSMCHGGASPSRDQFTIWSHEDFHSRAYATLVTARSARIAESLGIASATESAHCTTCHAPLADVPPGHLASTTAVTEGVSCESCHNGAASWLRGHTRPDWTYADRLHAGMRDLRSAYVRANTCVACHQVLDPALAKAGHPELIFELDGQAASEPRHWTEKADWFGPKAWLVGQAVALREVSRQAEATGDSNLFAQQNALVWLLEQVPGVGPSYAGKTGTGGMAPWSNQVAQAISGQNWSSAKTSDAVAALAATSGSFTDNKIPLAERELRAERLVLGLDRLFRPLHPEPSAPGQAELSALFDAVQDHAQFNAQTFASLLQKFADVVTPKK